MPNENRIYDVSRAVRAGMPVWPGDPEVRLEWKARLSEGDDANLAEIRTGVHAGTHADGAYHVSDDGPRLAEGPPLEAYLGRARLVDASGRTSLDAAWVRGVLTDGTERLLVRTGCWPDPDTFPTDFPVLEEDAARALVDAGVRLFGTDAPSVDAFDADEPAVHHVLLPAGMAVLESMQLDGVPEGDYELIALPLRLEEADSAPVRAVLRAL
jgi:arylformamidase